MIQCVKANDDLTIFVLIFFFLNIKTIFETENTQDIN